MSAPQAKLADSARKVQDAARTLGLDIDVMEMSASTRTAQDAAQACGCTVGQIVKSLVFRGQTSGEPYLLLVSGANRVNEKDIADAIGERLMRPDANYVRDVTGFAIGGIPPLGHDTPLRIFMDEDLLQYETVWAAAGTPRAVFAVAPGRLSDTVGARVLKVS